MERKTLNWKPDKPLYLFLLMFHSGFYVVWTAFQFAADVEGSGQ